MSTVCGWDLQLKIDQVLSQSDSCFLGAAVDEAGDRWLVLHRRQPESTTWVCANVSTRMLEELVSGRAAPSDIFRHSLTGTVEIVSAGRDRCIQCADLPENLVTVDRLHAADPGSEFAGETLSVSERVVISPAVGVFQPSQPSVDQGPIEAGTLLGTVGTEGVRSPFSGALMGVLALPGERVRVGQPIAWLRVDEAA